MSLLSHSVLASLEPSCFANTRPPNRMTSLKYTNSMLSICRNNNSKCLSIITSSDTFIPVMKQRTSAQPAFTNRRAAFRACRPSAKISKGTPETHHHRRSLCLSSNNLLTLWSGANLVQRRICNIYRHIQNLLISSITLPPQFFLFNIHQNSEKQTRCSVHHGALSGD